MSVLIPQCLCSLSCSHYSFAHHTQGAPSLPACSAQARLRALDSTGLPASCAAATPAEGVALGLGRRGCLYRSRKMSNVNCAPDQALTAKMPTRKTVPAQKERHQIAPSSSVVSVSSLRAARRGGGSGPGWQPVGARGTGRQRAHAQSVRCPLSQLTGASACRRAAAAPAGTGHVRGGARRVLGVCGATGGSRHAAPPAAASPCSSSSSAASRLNI